MSKTTTKVLREIVERFEHLEGLVATAFLRYERVDDQRIRVRVGEVAQAVADHRQEYNSPTFRHELSEAMRAIGVRRVKRQGHAYYCGVRLRKR